MYNLYMDTKYTTPSAGLQSYASTKVLNKVGILNKKNCRLGLPEVLEVVRVWSRLLPLSGLLSDFSDILLLRNKKNMYGQKLDELF